MKEEWIKMKIKINWYAIHEEEIWEVFIKKEYTDLWYEEMMRRFTALDDSFSEKDKQNYLREFPCFDIDESYECWEIWLPHLYEMLKFLKNK